MSVWISFLSYFVPTYRQRQGSEVARTSRSAVRSWALVAERNPKWNLPIRPPQSAGQVSALLIVQRSRKADTSRRCIHDPKFKLPKLHFGRGPNTVHFEALIKKCVSHCSSDLMSKTSGKSFLPIKGYVLTLWKFSHFKRLLPFDWISKGCFRIMGFLFF